MIFKHRLCHLQIFIFLIVLLFFLSCSGNNPNDGIPVSTFKVVNSFPHDTDAFTQGLVLDNGVLYEGTGLNGKSSLRRVDLETGGVLQNLNLSPQYFGEGITVLGDKIYQLTWNTNVGFIYDKDSFNLLGEFSYPTQGWGITHDGENLIMSDGTSTIHFLDPQTFENIRDLSVFDANGPVTGLNELEFIKGEIYANVFPTDRIARISPSTGRVIGWIDLTGLLSDEDRNGNNAVLNGIAYDETDDRSFVTGKLWPLLFEIKLVSAD